MNGVHKQEERMSFHLWEYSIATQRRSCASGWSCEVCKGLRGRETKKRESSTNTCYAIRRPQQRVLIRTFPRIQATRVAHMNVRVLPLEAAKADGTSTPRGYLLKKKVEK